jgi:N-acetyl sugar amidotransferase
MRRCKRCNLPETHETITFDDEGVCVVCRSHEIKAATNWGERKLQLDQLIDQYRDKGEYDCIVPFSGGKDSTWVLWYLTSTYGIKPLVVTFDHGFLRPRVMENTKRTMRRLGVDHHVYTPRWTVVRDLMTQSLKDKGDFCWHCHTGIFAYPMWIALETKTPLVVWGEQSAEYTAYYTHADEEEVDETRFNRINTLGITADDMRLRLGAQCGTATCGHSRTRQRQRFETSASAPSASVPMSSGTPTHRSSRSSVSSVGRKMKSRTYRRSMGTTRLSAICREFVTTSST